MPLYEYRCTACAEVFTEQLTISEHARQRPVCPACGSRAVEPVLSTFFAKTIRKS